MTPVHRRNTARLAEIERRALVWIAARLPAAVTPNALTATGMLGALIAMLGYFLAAGRPAMLWLASVGFVLNWFGDSLDGTLARVRGIERPHFGFFSISALTCLRMHFLPLDWGFPRLSAGTLRWRDWPRSSWFRCSA